MTVFLPPGTLTFATVLARLAEAWTPESWKAAPERERAVLESEDLHEFTRGTALRPGSVAAVTYRTLRPMLIDGRLPALLHVKVGPPRAIPAVSWLGDGAGTLRALLDGLVDFVLDGGAVERGTVLVAEGALAALLDGRPVPAPGAGPAEPVTGPTPEVRRNVGGRPRTHDDVAFVIIAARIAFEDRPANQARLAAAALDAYTASLPAGAEPPSDEWARRLVRRLWNGLALERTDAPRQG